MGEIIAQPKEGAFDEWDPANISPLVAYLSSEGCAFTGETFFVQGGVVKRVASWAMAETFERPGVWTVDDLAKELAPLAERVERDPANAYSVMALISSLICLLISSWGIAVCIAMIFIMSPWILILPAMKSCMATAWSLSMKSVLAVS